MRSRTGLRLGGGLVLVSGAGAAGAAKKAKPPLKPRYIDNRVVRLGVDLGSGGSVFYFARSATKRNLLNHRDLGRFVQQSYYGGKDGSVWAKKPWRWNPVQGGDYKGHPARLLDSKITPTSVYTKSVPKNWAGGQDIEDAVMEEWIRLRGRVAHIRFRFTYTGAEDHPPRHQELPAVFVDYDLPNLVFYRGEKPWTGGKLTRVVPGWPNESQRADECWAAYVDGKDWGIGVFFPGTPRMTTYRHKGRGDGGPNGTACSYFAPIRTLAIRKGFTFEYDVYLTIGKVNEIRERFGEIHSRRKGARPSR